MQPVPPFSQATMQPGTGSDLPSFRRRNTAIHNAADVINTVFTSVRIE
ncbi:MAG: hypothetical protein R6V62_01270 [Candidatus Fermentibacteraceae bacterium]